MNAVDTRNAGLLAQALISRLTVEIEASGRHVHLSQQDLEDRKSVV